MPANPASMSGNLGAPSHTHGTLSRAISILWISPWCAKEGYAILTGVMNSCQVASVFNAMTATALTVGVFGLAILGLVLIVKVLTARGGGWGTANPAIS